jgi:DNA ligase-associated metallophosphoesterase
MIAFDTAGDGLAFDLCGVRVTPLPEGALWIGDSATLIVSDLHLEKGSSYAARGVALPPYDTRATLTRLAAVITRLAPRQVVCLGDSLHDRTADARMAAQDIALISDLARARRWIWIEGNHDPAPPTHWGGERLEALTLGPLVLRHAPAAGPAPGEIAGHLHPVARISGHGRSTRRRSFLTDGARLVMPAFGAYAGGLNACDIAFTPLFPDGFVALALGRDRVWPAPQSRCLAD